MFKHLASALLGIAVVLSAGSLAQATTWIYNQSDDSLLVMCMSAYNGTTGSDGNLTFRPIFRLRPGESKEINVKFMVTNTLWIVVKNETTNRFRTFSDDLLDSNGRPIARVTRTTCYSPSNVSKNFSNEYIASEMIRGNWTPLQNSGLVAGLKEYSCTRIQPLYPHNKDPGFSIRITNSGLEYRKW